MTQVNKSAFWIIFFIVFIDLLGFGIVFPLLPLYIRQFHVDATQIGLVIGVYSLAQFIFAPLLGAWSDRIGRRPVLMISLLGTALSFFLLGWAKTFWLFFIARALDGIAGSNLSTAQAYIADISPREERTKNLGMWIGAAFGLGFAFGPFIGGALHMLGQAVMPQNALGFPFIAAGVLTLINTIFAFFKLPESLPMRDSEHAIGRRTFSWALIHEHLGESIGPLIVTYAISIFAFAQMEATFSFLSHDLFGLSDFGIYAVFGYLGFVMAMVQGGLVRRLAPILGDQKLTFFGCLIMSVSLATMPLSHHWVWLLVTAGGLAVGQSLANPALISSISKGTLEHIQGETMGVTQSLASLSRFLGPLMATWLYHQYGSTAPYWTAALVMLLAVFVGQLGFKKLTSQTLRPSPQG